MTHTRGIGSTTRRALLLALTTAVATARVHDVSAPLFEVVCCNPALDSDPASTSASASAASSADSRARFSAIYRSSHWTSAGGGSGEGSDPVAARGARRALLQVLRDPALRVRSLVDVGCGSLAWLPAVLDARDAAAAADAAAELARAAAQSAADAAEALLGGGGGGDDSGVSARTPSRSVTFEPLVYHGVDVVPELVEAHARRFGAGAGAEARPAWSFSSGDAAAAAFADSGIPTGADLLMSRDALQHLPLAHAARALENMATSGARLLLLGSYRVRGFNCDMATPGFFHWIDLRKAPFLLRPRAVFEEGFEAKQLLLFDGDELRRVDWAAMRARVAAHTSSDAFRAALSRNGCGEPPPLFAEGDAAAAGDADAGAGAGAG